MKESKIKRYRGLLVHLVASSALVGGFFVFFLNLPLLVGGLFSQKCWRWSHHLTLFGMGLLRCLQPWWRGAIEVKLPAEVLMGRSGCLCVSNHRSHMDVFLLLEQIPGVRILTKHLIFLIPGLGQAAVLFRMIRIKRGARESFWKAMERVEKAMRDGDTVHVFPEMTRAYFGQKELGRFTLVPFQKALLTGVPVVPIVIWGTDYLWPRGTYKIAWTGPLVAEALSPVSPKNFETASELSDHVRQVIQNRVNELSQLYPYGESS